MEVKYIEELNLDTLCQFLLLNADTDTIEKVTNYQRSGEINNLHKVVALQLNSKKLTSLPPEICLLKNLIKLELINNFLTDLPEELVSLDRLKVLHLAGNNFSHVPKVLTIMNLTQLFLNGNPLTEIPVSLKNVIRTYPSHSYWIDD